MKNIILSLLCALLISACHSGSSPSYRPAHCRETVATPYALWSEFIEHGEVLEQIPYLKAHSISLYQNIRSEQIGDPETGAFLDQAACHGIEVRAWLTLPEEDGYWPNEKNADLFIEKALELARWIRSSGWPIDWIVVDMEPDLQLMDALIAAAEEGRWLEAAMLILGNRDPESYAASIEAYTDLVDALHEMDFKVMVVTFPLVLDDLGDDDDNVQDLLNTPVNGVPWDEVSFMVYTTIFTKFLGIPMEPYLIYSYGLDAVRHYGQRAAVDLGVVGEGGMVEGQGIKDIRELRAQVGAAKAAGLKRVHVYSLEGILLLEDEAAWYGAFQAPASPPKKQAAVDLLRGLIQLADGLNQESESSPD